MGEKRVKGKEEKIKSQVVVENKSQKQSFGCALIKDKRGIVQL